MSRVATNNSIPHYSNGVGQSKTSLASRPSSNKNSIVNGSVTQNSAVGHGVTVRSAAPPPTQKETLHACSMCNGEYKDPRVLPCTHTYCFNCIRDKFISSNRVTCPKCNQQVELIDEEELKDLPRNLILSQEWRMNIQPAPAIPISKKPVTYPAVVSTPTKMSNQQDKRKPSIAESNGHESTSSRKKSHGIASLVHAFSRSSDTNGKQNGRTSRSPSVSSVQSIANLVNIYIQATNQLPEQKRRSESIASTGRSDELTKIFEQATHHQQKRVPSAPINRQASHAREEAYEEMTWDSLVPTIIPAAPPLPDQFQKATQNLHRPQDVSKRPSSSSESDRNSSIENLRNIIAGVNQHQHRREQTVPSLPQELAAPSQIISRPSTSSRSQNDFDDDDDDDDIQIPAVPSIYASVQTRQNNRPISSTGSYQSSTSSSITKPAPIPPIINTYQQQTSIPSTPPKQQQKPPPPQPQTTKLSHPSSSITSQTGRSPERLPLQVIDRYDFGTAGAAATAGGGGGGGGLMKRRSPSTMSIQSSASDELSEQIPINQTHLLPTERFKSSLDVPIAAPPNNTSRANSQINNDLSTTLNRPASKSAENVAHYLVPTPSVSTTSVAVVSRVDSLLSDQKRLEREIDEQIKRLKYDYDDIRKQINRKESSLYDEVRSVTSSLDHNITEHYQRQQRVYADLAADANTIGNELERLKSQTPTINNKQQFMDNLEKIEANIRNIRQAVEHQKQTRNALTFSEGHRSIGPDTIGQITYHKSESNQSFNSLRTLPPAPPALPPAPPTFLPQQSSNNIVPYKYVKIDHLSALEPESIAITPNNKKILLGICNKLFILNDYGDLLQTILLTPSIRGITISKKYQTQNIAYISHDETVSMIDIDNGQTLDCVKETDSSGESGTFLPLGIDTDNVRGDVYVCDYRNSCVIKFDDKLEFISQWRIYNHSDQYDEARPKLISVHGQKLYIIIEHSCKPLYNQGIAYTFSLHICDANSGNIIKIIDAELLGSQRLRWPCSVHAINDEKCYILDTMTSGKYFNGQWQKHWSRVLEVSQNDNDAVTELFQLDSEAATMAMTKQVMTIAANGDILFVDLGFLFKQQPQQQFTSYDHSYQNLP